MNAHTVTVPHFGLSIRIEMDGGAEVTEMDRNVRILTALAASDHDTGRPFARRFPFTCYSRAGEPIGRATIGEDQA